ncbi:hypothetical protein DPMN_079026 [Dreissena polymorpha]|uniref:Uncharacterized protein n=1 Tax=Dreissena polymorpha TaxID=45954 RepID=A0A9D3YSD4_DREPO|nr:hypothetical protein DPMN_079026 [Dreissena polymorpha]
MVIVFWWLAHWLVHELLESANSTTDESAVGEACDLNHHQRMRGSLEIRKCFFQIHNIRAEI